MEGPGKRRFLDKALTDRGNRGDDFAQFELVEDSRFAGRVEANCKEESR